MNPEWVEAVEKAMDSSLSPEFQWWESSEERITFILGVAEPLIRADERERREEFWEARWREAAEQREQAWADLAYAEAVAARLVEVICEQESLIIWNIRWREQAEAEKGHLRDQIDGVAELLHRQRVQHAALIAPTHPTAPVLIEVDRILALIGGSE